MEEERENRAVSIDVLAPFCLSCLDEFWHTSGSTDYIDRITDVLCGKIIDLYHLRSKGDFFTVSLRSKFFSEDYAATRVRTRLQRGGYDLSKLEILPYELNGHSNVVFSLDDFSFFVNSCSTTDF